MIKLSRGSGPKYISEFSLETNVTKSVGELDDIKKTVRSISGTVTTLQNEVKELSKKYVVINWKNILLESGSFGLSVP
jgi:archaellum component FlaC